MQLIKIINNISYKIPYIPDFRDFRQLLKILIGILYIMCVFSFIGLEHMSEYFSRLNSTIIFIYPFIIIELVLLWLSNNIIKKISPFSKIIFLIGVTILDIYIIESLTKGNFYFFDGNLEPLISESIVGLGLLFFFLIYFDWNEKNNNPDQLKAQLLALQSKMQPHFLFNTINTIVYLIKNDPSKARKMLIDLAEIFRANLFDNDDNMTTIDSEINISKKYLEIERIRLGERLNVVWNINPNIDKYKMPKFILQPLIENSVLHGIQNLESGGKIEVSIECKNKYINFVVVNDFNKLSTIKKRGNGVSLKNMEKRMNMIYNSDFHMNESHEDGKYKTEIKIPMEKNYAD